MPRKRKPGARPPGRADLAPVAAEQGTRNFTGRGYGDRLASQALQNVAPLADRSTDALLAAAPGAAGPAGQPAPGPATDVGMLEQFLAAAQGAQPPGEGLLTAETARPDEPLTAGLDAGAGPGSDALPPVATTGPDPSIVLWARQLPALELLAAQPGSSPQVRQFVRRIRSQLPADFYARTEI